VSANFTTSALNRFTFNYLLKTLLRGFPPVYPFLSPLFATRAKSVQPHSPEEGVTDGHINVIVARCVLQRERVRMLSCLRYGGVPQPQRPRIETPIRIGNDASSA
jgi:hypothetical protein